ncbi:twin-arginine translocation signal domain-containing protein [Actinomadura barringtoniae]|uniref:Twin-arginine translocation signal domain-containing protein n=1 Tax=Actinomadura barringtoniae TaxID=1427535 RepID=A0A939TFX8_9ACTN|nr:twin-arginine translocation signal domain-containing protein [Actinomadura barringtoniae]MBO2454855.1 twin-arginine translocation signal domain-containing protein [Actinomadura barringtoniae]
MRGQQKPDLATVIDYVKRWERGKVGISSRNRRAYAQAFAVPQRHLFAPTVAADDDDPVERRDFLGLSVAAAGLAVAPAGLADQESSRIGMELVERLRRRTARLRRLDDVLGGSQTYSVYAAELSATRNLISNATYTEATGRGLVGVAAEQAQQAGWAALDSGRMAAARSLFRDSMTAASDIGDTGLIGNALALMAYQRVSTGRPGTDEADASCRVVDRRTPPAVRALLHERAAWAHAVAGPTHSDEVEKALGQAADALAEDRLEGPDPDWARWVDEIELQIMTGRCWAVLRRPVRAIPALRWALARYDDTHARDKALYSTWLADAHIDAQEIEQGAHALGQAIDLGSDVASPRPGERIAEVAERLRVHADVPEVAEVLERARTMTLLG